MDYIILYYHNLIYYFLFLQVLHETYVDKPAVNMIIRQANYDHNYYSEM